MIRSEIIGRAISKCKKFNPDAVTNAFRDSKPSYSKCKGITSSDGGKSKIYYAILDMKL